MTNVRRSKLSPKRLKEPTPDAVRKPDFKSGPMGLAAVWDELVAEARRRRLQHHKRLKEIRPLTAGNWHSVYPLAGQRFTFAH